jgi:translation initiation factor 5B
VARDGVLPLSSWIGKVDDSKQPRNAVTVMYVFGACLLCTILPSQVAFTSLISAGGIPTTAAYGLIALLRLFITPNDFKSSKFKLGRFAKPFYIAAALFNALVFSVQVSPFFFPVTAETFNFVSPSEHNSSLHGTHLTSLSPPLKSQAGVILGSITIFAILSWWFVPGDKWLTREQVVKAMNSADEEPKGST